jgi:GNAT superfamily N-acetyltransferase
MTENVKSKRTNSNDQDFINLITLLDKSLWQKYPQKGKDYWCNNLIEFNQNVIVIYVDDKQVACGCFKKYNDKSIEIKRMFVAEEVRGIGLAKILLNELETWALENGFTTAILETLFNQTAAIGLYQRVGYTIIDNYGPYKNSEESICMGKQLLAGN